VIGASEPHGRMRKKLVSRIFDAQIVISSFEALTGKADGFRTHMLS
jgi:hypothetical protein